MKEKSLMADVDVKLIQGFPKKILREHRLLPIKKEEDTIIFLSERQPPLTVLDDLEVYSSCQIEVKLVDTKLIKKLVNEYLEAPLDTVEEMVNDFEGADFNQYSELEVDSEVENLEELAHEAPVIRMVNAIITTGLKNKASDIHIEPFEDRVDIRYRIDGVLYHKTAPPKRLLPAVITRIKIMANLDIAQRRLPQDGRIRIKVLGRELDIRVSIVPTLYGESVVLRLLDRAAILLELDNLGFAKQDLVKYSNLIKLSHGIILVTGPTGSGKTTTLYATLNALNSSQKKIITIEDPIEYQLDGINQIQVKPEIDFNFAQGLRSILRQDPDIIMIGEIRDLETAKIAVQAALTGHLVFATLHTNNAAGAINRLLDMGVEDYLLADTLQGVMAQRLVRVLCPECKIKAKVKQQGLKKAYQSRGCSKCNEIGFTGRMGIYELLVIDDEMAALISAGQQQETIETLANNRGLKTLFDDGLEKVKAGFTTVKEVLRVSRN